MCYFKLDQSCDLFFLQLCLRKWTHLHPSAEFRCFVHNNQLIGRGMVLSEAVSYITV